MRIRTPGAASGAVVSSVLSSNGQERRPARGAGVTYNPPFPGGDSAGNLKLNAVGKIVLCRFEARYTGTLTKLHFQVRNLLADGTSYTAGTLGTYKCEIRRVLANGLPDMTAAGLLATETFTPDDARIVNYNAYMNASLFMKRGEEYFFCISNSDPSPTVNHASINFLYSNTSPLPGAQGRNERDPYATDLYLGMQARELVGGTSDGGATFQLPGNTDPANTLIKHIFPSIQEFSDGTKRSPNPYYTATGSSGNADGAWVMTYRNIVKAGHITHIACFLQGAGTSAATLSVNGIARATASLVGAAYGYAQFLLSSEVYVQPGDIVTVACTVDHTGAAGLNVFPVYGRGEWITLLGGTSVMDWEATTKPAGITGANAGAAIPVWPVPWKDEGQIQISDAAFDVNVLAQRFTSQRYYGGQGSLSTSSPSEGAVQAWPFLVGERCLFDRIGIETTVAGATGAVVRLGIYADNGHGSPGALVLDAGPVSAITIAYLEATISQILAPGLYWLASVTQGAAATRPTYRVNTGSAPIAPILAGALTGILATGAGGGGVNTASAAAAGALPSPFPAVQATGTAPRVVLRAA